jgi:hypothetical protein
MYVYFIKARSSPPTMKIGKANDPEMRMAELQTGCPFEMRLMGTLKCKSQMHSHAIEQRLHRLFRKEATRGEWFRYSGPLPYFVNQILKVGDPDCVEAVFARSFNVLKSQKGNKRKKAVESEEYLSPADIDSLAHLRSIRAEGSA